MIAHSQCSLRRQLTRTFNNHGHNLRPFKQPVKLRKAASAEESVITVPAEAQECTTSTDVAPPSQEARSSQQPSNVNVRERSRSELWWAAVKPPMYSVGFIPVMVGAAAAFFEKGFCSLSMAGGLIVAAILVIAWLNLSNDAFDAATGVDETKPESVVNLTGNRMAVLALAFTLLAAGAGTLYYLISLTQDWRIAGMLAFSIACGYVYQSPPFRLSYKGLGEPLCFFAFGPSATTAFYLALSSAPGAAITSIPPVVTALSTVVGITTTVILFCSHWHQIEGDRKNNKFSPLVRLGSTEKALPILVAATVSPYVVAVCATLVGALPIPALLASLLSVPAAVALIRFAFDNHHSAPLIAPLKIFATKWHILHNLCWVAGLCVSRLVA